MRKVSIFLFIVICGLSFIRAARADTCVDPDGSDPGQAFKKNIVTFSTASGRSYPDTDKCSPDGKSVWEMYCPSPTTVYNIKAIPCREGCQDGACRPEISCVDTDPSNSPETVGLVTVTRNGENIARSVDSCTSSGRVLSQVSCSSQKTIVKESRPCLQGCVAGRCGPAVNGVDGCFFKIEVAIKHLHGQIIVAQPKVREVIGTFASRVLFPYPDTPPTGVGKLELRGGSGNTIAAYQFDPGFEIYIEGRTAPALAISTAGTVVGYLPFRADAKELALSYRGKTMKVALPLPVCAAPCVLHGDAGRYELSQTCCPGAIQRPLNDESFTCITSNATPSAIPSPKSS